MQTCCPDEVQVGPFEQDVVQELEADCSPAVGESFGRLFFRRLRAAEAESAEAIAVSV